MAKKDNWIKIPDNWEKMPINPPSKSVATLIAGGFVETREGPNGSEWHRKPVS